MHVAGDHAKSNEISDATFVGLLRRAVKRRDFNVKSCFETHRRHENAPWVDGWLWWRRWLRR